MKHNNFFRCYSACLALFSTVPAIAAFSMASSVSAEERQQAPPSLEKNDSPGFVPRRHKDLSDWETYFAAVPELSRQNISELLKKEPVKLEKIEDIATVQPGSVILCDIVLEKLLFPYRASDKSSDDDRNKIGDRRKAFRIINSSFLRIDTEVKIRKCKADAEPGSPAASVQISFSAIRDYSIKLFSPQPGYLSEFDGKKAVILLQCIQDFRTHRIEGYKVLGIGLSDSLALTSPFGMPEHLPACQPDTFAAMSNYYEGLVLQEKGSLKAAVEKYEAALKCDPEAASILNHCAWLFATTEDPSLRNPEKSVGLALKAIESSRRYGTGQLGDFLDTAARAYMENGNLDKAFEYETAALKIIPDHQEYAGQMKLIREKMDALKPK